MYSVSGQYSRTIANLSNIYFVQAATSNGQTPVPFHSYIGSRLLATTIVCSCRTEMVHGKTEIVLHSTDSSVKHPNVSHTVYNKTCLQYITTMG